MAKTALVATRDDSGLESFARYLQQSQGYVLRKLSIAFDTGFEDIESVDLSEAQEMIAEATDLILIANFYDPVTAGRDFMSWKKALSAFDHELVDLVRSAARRPESIAILGAPSAYEQARTLLEDASGLPQSFCVAQACNAFFAVSRFDVHVGEYLERHAADAPDIDALAGFPKTLSLSWKRARSLADGETSRQKAALYGSFCDHFEIVAGSDWDYLSIVDATSATFAIGEFEKTTAVVSQGGAILSAASAESGEDAVERAFRSVAPDASHLTLAVNATMDSDFVKDSAREGLATVIAPRFVVDAYKGPLRLVESREGLGYEALQEIRSVVGGIVAQDKNRAAINPFAWKLPSANQPLVEDWDSMLFGAKIARHLRSCACVAVKEEAIVSVASGLDSQSRFKRRFEEQSESVAGALLIFDEDIADPQVLKSAKDLGVSLLVHPGVEPENEHRLVEVANQLGMALVSTGVAFTRYA